MFFFKSINKFSEILYSNYRLLFHFFNKFFEKSNNKSLNDNFNLILEINSANFIAFNLVFNVVTNLK